MYFTFDSILNSIKRLGDKNKFFARPGQELNKHYSNMFKGLAEISPKLNQIFNLYGNLVNVFQELKQISIISHDIGKISPFFQWKISNLEKKIPEEIKNYSYHTATGAIFGIIFVNNYLFLNNERFFDHAFFKPDFIDFAPILIPYSVKSHHSPILQEIQLLITEEEKESTLKIIDFIKKAYKFEEIFKIFKFLDKPEFYSLNITLEKSLKEFLNLNKHDLDQITDDFIWKWEDISNKKEYFLLLKLFHGYLIDLDEWDAMNQTFENND